jgi:hypothetical protein
MMRHHRKSKKISDSGDSQMSEVAQAIEAVAQAVTDEVKQEVAKVEEKIRIEISDAEKFMLTKMENEFLKAQMEVKRLTELMQNIQKAFPTQVEELVKKYAIEPAKYTFDAIELAFKKKQ